MNKYIKMLVPLFFSSDSKYKKDQFLLKVAKVLTELAFSDHIFCNNLKKTCPNSCSFFNQKSMKKHINP